MLLHSDIVLRHWDSLHSKIQPTAVEEIVDGHSLDLATIISIARYGTAARIDNGASKRLMQSSDIIHNGVASGKVIYGVNTGYGGSADTRTTDVEGLQRTLIRELHCGILVHPARDVNRDHVNGKVNGTVNGINGTVSGEVNGKGTEEKPFSSRLSQALMNEDAVSTTCMPEAWVRAALLIRINSLIHGCSGVRTIVVERMMDLLDLDIIPRVPMHGSISASGDLSPLSYVGGVIEGQPNLTVWSGQRASGQRTVTTAAIALREANLKPVRLVAKEGLAIVNGTAISCAAAALAIHDAHGLSIISQLLTAMSVEALCGNEESFDPYFATVRPHPGQIDSARNILAFLRGSSLTQANEGTVAGALRQDRYSIRTASQWIGPVLEDLVLAHEQIIVESNSVTDNPLVCPQGRFLHGGNFQAKAVTSAMEKTRQGLQSIGQMLFAQCTELINPATNRGLPPNLVAEDPSQSFIFKSVDIMLAALLSELGFLANPVGSHVQHAEMGNQALNSLALISARYTHTAADVLSKLAAAHLLAVCQALDLRALRLQFLNTLAPPFRALLTRFLSAAFPPLPPDALHAALWPALQHALDKSTSMDSAQRFPFVAKTLQPTIIALAPPTSSQSSTLLPSLLAWTAALADLLAETHRATVDAYFAHGSAAPLLGAGSRRMYEFVRQELAVPFLRTEVIKTLDDGAGAEAGAGRETPTVGTLIGRIHAALRDGGMYVPAGECLRKAAVAVAAAAEEGAAGMKEER